VRSHLLKPGIASFSVITGSNTTISRNHTQKAAIQSKVDRNVQLIGGAGSGFDQAFSVTEVATGERGTHGSGLESLCKFRGMGAAMRLAGRMVLAVLNSFGGTGGPSSCECGFRFRTCWSFSPISDIVGL
jgi:hypothetical protein